jgi:hypothetical protein
MVGPMRRICLLLSFVALCATTLTVAPAGPARAHGATQATNAMTPSDMDALAYQQLRGGRSDARIGSRPALGLLSAALRGPTTSSPHAGPDRPSRAVLLDGSDRWRSLLLGAPPLVA